MTAAAKPEEADTSGPLRTGGMRGVIGNIVSLFGVRVVDRATSFVMYALVARFLERAGLGQLTLAVALLQLFGKFTVLGVQTLATREIAKQPQRTGPFLVHSGLVVLATSIVGMGAVAVFNQLMGYEPETARTIQILFLALIPFSLIKVSEGVFVGWERSKYAAYSTGPVFVAQVAVLFVLLMMGAGIEMVAFTLVSAYILIFAIQWWVAVRKAGRLDLHLDLDFTLSMLRSASPFLGIQGINAIAASVNVVILSRVLGEAAVGIYSAAAQLLVPLTLIVNSTAFGVFPLMVRRFQRGVETVRRVANHILEVMSAITLPAVTGLFILAPSLLVVLFGRTEFLESTVVARIMVLLPLEIAYTSVFGQLLWASNHEKEALRIAIVNTVVRVASAVALIAWFGVVGAAISALIVGVINMVQHYLPVSRLLGGIGLLRFVWRPAVASASMAVVLLLTLDRMHVLIQVGVGALVYCLAFAVVLVWSEGGTAAVRRRFRALWAQA